MALSNDSFGRKSASAKGRRDDFFGDEQRQHSAPQVSNKGTEARGTQEGEGRRVMRDEDRRRVAVAQMELECEAVGGGDRCCADC